MNRLDELPDARPLQPALAAATSPDASASRQDEMTDSAERALAGTAGARVHCRFCDHGNPAHARFCNSCGGQLDLQPCPACGVVNPIDAASCAECRTALLESLPDIATAAAAGTAEAVTDGAIARHAALILSSSGPQRRRPPMRGIHILAIACIAAAGAAVAYYAHQRAPVVDSRIAAPRSPDAAPGKPTADGAVSPHAESDGAAATGTAHRGTAKIHVRGTAACSESMSALGLCADVAVPRTQPIRSAPATAPTSSTSSSQPGTRCTAGQDALGLCAPANGKEKE